MFKIYKGILAPNCLLNLLARDKSARMIQEKCQNPGRLLLDPDSERLSCEVRRSARLTRILRIEYRTLETGQFKDLQHASMRSTLQVAGGFSGLLNPGNQISSWAQLNSNYGALPRL